MRFRSVFIFISVLSLAFFAATCILWARSYRFADSIGYDTLKRVPDSAGRDHFKYKATTGRGGIQFAKVRGTLGVLYPAIMELPQTLGERKWWRYCDFGPVYPANTPDGRPRLYQKIGFDTVHVTFEHDGKIDSIDAITIPFWAIAVVFGILPVVRIVTGRKKRNEILNKTEQQNRATAHSPD